MSERSSSALVSVVIPVHDAAEYISDTLSSILSQSLQDIEVIIIDDNSADDTLKLLQSFAANDSRIRLLNNSQNIGAGASRNMGLKIASGEYIIFLMMTIMPMLICSNGCMIMLHCCKPMWLSADASL